MEKRRCSRKKAGFGPAGRETLRLTGRMAAALTRLNSGQLFHAARMASALKAGSQERVHQLHSKAGAHHAPAHAKGVGVVVHARIFGAEHIGTAAGADGRQ